MKLLTFFWLAILSLFTPPALARRDEFAFRDIFEPVLRAIDRAVAFFVSAFRWLAPASWFSLPSLRDSCSDTMPDSYFKPLRFEARQPLIAAPRNI